MLGLSLYNVTTNLLMLKAWYAMFVFGLVPLGVIFFSFAAGCAIKGIFSLLLGKAAATSLLHAAGDGSCCLVVAAWHHVCPTA